MGYRFYLYQLDKEPGEKLRNSKSKEELIKVCKEYYKNVVDEDEEDSYISLCEIDKEIFEFGKTFIGYDTVYKNAERFFKNEEVQELFSEEDPILCTKETFKQCIEAMQEHLKEYYAKLVDVEHFGEQDKFDEMIDGKFTEEEKHKNHFARLLKHCQDTYNEIRFGGMINLIDDCERVSDSWLYEHIIFELVRLYKTIDYDNSVLMICGW